MSRFIHKRKRLTSFQIIILGFSGVIFLGTVFLMLPFSSQKGIATPFIDALFTSASAVCVTGLVIYDTATYWSGFGQLIIMLLIQIGGMGVVTVAASVAMISGRKISLMQRSTMQEAIAAPKVGGIIRLTNFIVKITLWIEFLGAIVMAPIFCRDFGIKGLWMALFHSVSAFCNAGFDLMGGAGAFSSLTSYRTEPVICITIILLIVVGGIGFLTWDDIRINRYHLHKYRMQSKVILCTTTLLLVFPFIYFFFYEFNSFTMQERLLSSLFQTVTPRTAGFNTIELTTLSEVGKHIIIILMLIGGSPGSTAGGMKTTTVAVLFAASISTFFRKDSTHFFGRRIDDQIVKNAATILLMYLTLFMCGAFIISMVEELPMIDCLFETASAVGTVGLSLGVTTQVGAFSKFILIQLMFLGRVGGLTLIFAALSNSKKEIAKLPQEKITVG